MGFDLISNQNVIKIKKVLLETPLIKPLKFDIKELNLIFFSDVVSQPIESENFEGMLESYFMVDEKTKIMEVNGKKYEVFLI